MNYIRSIIKTIIHFAVITLSKIPGLNVWIDNLKDKYHKKKGAEYLCALIREHGNEVLEKLNEISAELHKPIWPECGTLLGAYRNKTFIPHDFDMDYGMNYEDYDDEFEAKMEEKGFIKTRFFTLHKKGDIPRISESSWVYKGMILDIFLSFKDEDHRYVYLYGEKDSDSYNKGNGVWEAREYTHPMIEPYETVLMNGIQLVAPHNTRQCLINYYGEGYMVPDKKYSAADRNKLMKIYELNEAYGVCTYF
jgi:lipopolysaccharide cholinephosphotransferase